MNIRSTPKERRKRKGFKKGGGDGNRWMFRSSKAKEIKRGERKASSYHVKKIKKDRGRKTRERKEKRKGGGRVDCPLYRGEKRENRKIPTKGENEAQGCGKK